MPGLAQPNEPTRGTLGHSEVLSDSMNPHVTRNDSGYRNADSTSSLANPPPPPAIIQEKTARVYVAAPAPALAPAEYTNANTNTNAGQDYTSTPCSPFRQVTPRNDSGHEHAGSAGETTTTGTGAISLSGPAPASSSSSANRNLPTITPEDPARTYVPAAFPPTPDYSDMQDFFSYPFEQVTPWSSGSSSAQPPQRHPQPHYQHQHQPQHQQQTFKRIIAEMPHSAHRQPLTQPQPHAFPRLPYMSDLQAHQGPGSFPYDPAPRPSGSGNGRNGGGGNAIEVTIDPAEEEIWVSDETLLPSCIANIGLLRYCSIML